MFKSIGETKMQGSVQRSLCLGLILPVSKPDGAGPVVEHIWKQTLQCIGRSVLGSHSECEEEK
jgi:hypothetical protein